MSLTPGSFRPDELAGGDGTPGDPDLAAAYSTARELQAALPAERVMPSPGFADRVMAAVALEPAPRRAGFIAVLRAHPGPAGLAASLREAWAVLGGGPGRPAAARGLALAYVLAVVVIGTSVTGIAAYGAAGALGLIDDASSPSPTITTPSPTLTPEPSITPEPVPTPDSSTSPEPSASEEPTPSATASPTARPTATSRPTPSPTPSDDHGDESPSPSPDDDHSPEPGDTPRPSDTPKPSESPG